MDNVTAVVLAAGLSRRMGERNKLLLPVGGQPIIRRTVAAYAARCRDVIVVTGFEADKVCEAVQDLNVRLVHNPDFASGQPTSVATGLRAAQGAMHVLMGLGDQPLLKTEAIDALVRAHLDAGGHKISIPHDGQSRGNPIAIPGSLIEALLEDRQNPGCRTFTRERTDMVSLIPLSDPAYFQDIDTPEDYANLAQQKEGAV